MLDLVTFLPVLLATGVLAWIGRRVAGLGREGPDGHGGESSGSSGGPRLTPAGPLPPAGPDDLARSA